MTPRNILIVKTGDPVPVIAERRGPFARMIEETLGSSWEGGFETVDGVSDRLGDPKKPAAIIVTGSAANVPNREPWMLTLEAWMRDAHQAGTPILGICFGHQILAQALGGSAVKNPKGREIGTIRVTRLEDDPIFDGAPESFEAQASHIDTTTLPPGATRLARSPLDENHAIRFSSTTYGVQYHPEFDGEIMRGYLETRRAVIASEGLPIDEIVASVTETQHAARTLVSFVRFILPRASSRA